MVMMTRRQILFKDDLGIAINDNDDVEEDFISNDDRENWSHVGRTGQVC